MDWVRQGLCGGIGKQDEIILVEAEAKTDGAIVINFFFFLFRMK